MYIDVCDSHPFLLFQLHSLAQGKIGSGFDVSSACFGSQVYTRFSPVHLDPLLRDAERKNLSATDCRTRLVSATWDNVHIQLALPQGIQLLLGDVSVGSNTPTMVSKVLQWKKDNPEQSAALWERIDGENGRIRQALAALQKQPMASLLACAKLNSSEWVGGGDEAGRLLFEARDAFVQARRGLREMGTLADVPIEPSEQTELCDATMQELGVLAAGVPGAGGFDAIFALVIGDEALARVESLWVGWKTRVLPMVVREDPRGVEIE